MEHKKYDKKYRKKNTEKKIQRKNNKLYRSWISIRALRKKRGYSVCEDWLKSYDVFQSWYFNNFQALRIINEKICIVRRDKSLGFSPDNCFLGTIQDVLRGRKSWTCKRGEPYRQLKTKLRNLYLSRYKFHAGVITITFVELDINKFTENKIKYYLKKICRELGLHYRLYPSEINIWIGEKA